MCQNSITTFQNISMRTVYLNSRFAAIYIIATFSWRAKQIQKFVYHTLKIRSFSRNEVAFSSNSFKTVKIYQDDFRKIVTRQLPLHFWDVVFCCLGDASVCLSYCNTFFFWCVIGVIIFLQKAMKAKNYLKARKNAWGKNNLLMHIWWPFQTNYYKVRYNRSV